MKFVKTGGLLNNLVKYHGRKIG